MDLSSLLPILTGVLAVTTLVAAAFAGLMIGTQRTLRDSNADLRDRVKDLEDERKVDKATIARIDAADKEKAGEIKMLTSMIQGRVDWTAISDQLEEHHRQALSYWERSEQHLSGIEAALKGGNQ